jgi:Putative Ig domain
VFALAVNNCNGGNNATDSIYTHTGNLYEVTASSDGTCTPPAADSVLCTATGAANTYNGPTGWGTPDGLTAFESNSTSGNTVTVTNPGNQTGTVGTAVSLQINATDSASGQTLTYSATGLPAGLSISSSTGLISGTPTTAATSSVTVTATDTTGASGSASFTWTVSSAGGGGCTAQQLLGNPGFETGSISPWSSTAGVLASTSEGVPSQAGSYLAWLDGYGTAHTDTLAQTVTIPANCTSAVFTYWVEVNSTTTNTRNTLVLDILNSSGTVVQTVSVATAANNGTSYVEHSTSLASYIGQTITVKFVGTEVSGGNTSFFEDSNALNVD